MLLYVCVCGLPSVVRDVVSQLTSHTNALTYASPSIRNLLDDETATQWVEGQTHSLDCHSVPTRSSRQPGGQPGYPESLHPHTHDFECETLAGLIACAWRCESFTCTLTIPPRQLPPSVIASAPAKDPTKKSPRKSPTPPVKGEDGIGASSGDAPDDLRPGMLPQVGPTVSIAELIGHSAEAPEVPEEVEGVVRLEVSSRWALHNMHPIIAIPNSYAHDVCAPLLVRR